MEHMPSTSPKLPTTNDKDHEMGSGETNANDTTFQEDSGTTFQEDGSEAEDSEYFYSSGSEGGGNDGDAYISPTRTSWLNEHTMKKAWEMLRAFCKFFKSCVIFLCQNDKKYACAKRMFCRLFFLRQSDTKNACKKHIWSVIFSMPK